MPLLSVIVPVYNEANNIRQILEKINAAAVDKEIIVVDDGSSDGTDKILHSINYPNLKIIHHTTNRGKGTAFLTALSHAAGDFVVIQDADLAYNPDDYLRLIDEVRPGRADIAIGARPLSGPLMQRLGNKFISALLNFLFRSQLNDCFSCYKLAAKGTWYTLNLRAGGFDIDAEIICNALKKKKRIKEMPISYQPLACQESKKISSMQGVWRIFYLFKYRIVD